MKILNFVCYDLMVWSDLETTANPENVWLATQNITNVVGARIFIEFYLNDLDVHSHRNELWYNICISVMLSLKTDEILFSKSNCKYYSLKQLPIETTYQTLGISFYILPWNITSISDESHVLLCVALYSLCNQVMASFWPIHKQ